MHAIELIPSLALLAGGLIAGFLNVVAGGGTLITLPLLIFLGMPATSANGTVRLAILVQCMTASYRYHRAGAVRWAELPRLVVPATLGAIAGALIATHMANTDFRSLIGGVTLAAGALVAFDLKLYLSDRAISQTRTRAAIFAVSLVAVGFYAGLAQAGVGYLILASFVLGGGYSLVEANVLKVAMVMCFTPIVILIFGLSAQIHVGYAIVLTVGQAAGAYLGAGASLKRGAHFIRPVLACVVVAAAIRLIFF